MSSKESMHQLFGAAAGRRLMYQEVNVARAHGPARAWDKMKLVQKVRMKRFENFGFYLKNKREPFICCK